MRFISPHRGYSMNIRNPAIIYDKFNQEQVVEPGLVANFDIGPAPENWELDLAEEKLAFKGMPSDPGGAPLPVKRRVSIFDTEQAQEEYGWSDDDRRLVEEKLLKWQNADEFVQSVKPPALIPWPAYDSVTSAAKIKKLVEDVGIDPQNVVEYERENANRADVLSAMDELVLERQTAPDAEQEVVVRA